MRPDFSSPASGKLLHKNCRSVKLASTLDLSLVTKGGRSWRLKIVFFLKIHLKYENFKSVPQGFLAIF